ncbi:MAG: glucose-1-phosphate thymidylyltransferase [Nitrosopumilaceae archaeon]|nr:glucose-1-phosphate thymidylyltransferase [Nitrosopumilaceae archaeon]NIU01396.1 glucose-1-phosphate thymidylyltransferase [Nitrosopumilaceae archaeon]NIU87754.1 glucose-1-phosphate thymidylyltransferase [Nitrosopumilaceae archaeon]NIV66132.1 glucose-1-phosphate thymidylyltransferase [Nitrosopumilaceae archaeon]NIX61998.1 glucose-1-phosphate thymidylyltransferase [Nitrosopumilaceae archaeon]
MKGIILHGGYGTRLGPLTQKGPKQLIPLANKPMSQYALDDLKNSGITDIGIIVGDVFPEKVKNYYGDGSKFGVRITYIHQDKPKGISHAIGLCKEFVGNERFVVYLGDNVMRKDLESFVTKFQDSQSEFMILLSEVDDPSKFGIAEFEDDKIVKISEKPQETSSNKAVIGVYFFTPKIFDIISVLEPSKRGELEVTDALQLALERGLSIGYQNVSGWWKDTGTIDDILDATKLILDTMIHYDKTVEEKYDKKSEGIYVGKNTTIEPDCILEKPVIIGENCIIKNSRLGPYTCIGSSSEIIGANIENSIIMEDCKIKAKQPISKSVIANETIIDSSNSNQFILGEKSNIKLENS